MIGDGLGPVHLDSVECSRSEQRLIDCPATMVNDLYDHSRDVGVQCRDTGIAKLQHILNSKLLS